MATKPKAPATRTTRSKAPAPAPAATTTRTTRAAAKAKDPSPLAAPKKITSRKAVWETDEPKAATLPKKTNSQPSVVPPDDDSEPIKAFLRIRPYLGDGEPSDVPYLENLNATTVRMNDPSGSVANPSRYRLSTTPQSSIYSFSHVFEPSTTQSDFFSKTTLPLVQDLLQGQNGLLFAYGVTNSGKTHSMQGGHDPSSAGIVPRTFDVIFNSIGSLQSDNRAPTRLHGVEPATFISDADNILSLPQDPGLAGVLEDELESDSSDAAVDATVLQVDRNHSHSIWLSYVEVYNEKVYDLLADTDSSSSTRSGPNLLLSRKALALKPSPPSDWDGSQNIGKYISGLRQVRVHSAAQAKALLKRGQLHRKVFGTLANSQSSRSHALVTIKLLRGHRGEYDDPSSIQTSRLTLVDLAGSERTKNTQTTGDRLREAGSINKSLMVLGQCMEVMRSNQKRLAQSLASIGRVDTRDVKKNLAVVPFRHSKLTEILMDYFIGDGRVIMIVNVNPYDTGFDENSHVMKFAALTREVLTTTGTNKPPRPPSKASQANKPPARRQNEPHRRKVTISMGARGRQSEACVDILEEDEEMDDLEDEETDLEKGFVGALFDEIDDLRMQLFEAEMRCAIIEAETREEVMQEMEERMRNMERMFMKRITNEVEQSERKMDAKIDMLHQAGLLGQAKQIDEEAEDEDEDEDDKEAEEEETFALSDIESDEDEETDEEQEGRGSSPLAGKSSNQPKHPPRSGKPRGLRLPKSSDDEDSQVSDSDDRKPVKPRNSKPLARAPSPIFEEDVKRGTAQATRAKPKRDTLTGLAENMEDLSLKNERPSQAKKPARRSAVEKDVEMNESVDESVIILPPKTTRKSDPAEGSKKKKRILSKTPVVTEDQIEKKIEESDKGRRVVRSSRS